MKAKQLLALLIACAVVCAAGWITINKRQKSWESGSINGSKLFPDLAINDVRKIVIRSKDNTVELERDGDHWVNASHYGYAADFKKISEMLIKLHELKAAHLMQVDAADYGRLDLNMPDAEEGAGTVIELFDADGKSLRQIVLGKDHKRQGGGNASPFGGGDWPNGRYVLNPATATVATVEETFSQARDQSDSWVDKTFFKVEKIRSGTAFDGETEVWHASRASESGTLAVNLTAPEGKELDTSKVSRVDSALRYPSFKKIADPAKSDDDLGLAGGRRFVAETFDGFTYTLTFGAKTADGDVPVRIAVAYEPPPPPEPPADETPEQKTQRETTQATEIKEAGERAGTESKRFAGWVYLVSSYTFEPLRFASDEFFKDEEKQKDAAAGDTGAAALPVPETPTVLLPEAGDADDDKGTAGDEGADEGADEDADEGADGK